MIVSLWILAPVVLATALGILAVVIGVKKDRHTALGLDPVPPPGAEYDFDFEYSDDRAAGERQKHRCRAELLQPVIVATVVAAGISTVAAVVPHLSVAGMTVSLLIVGVALLREQYLYRYARAHIDASTEYLIFYQKAKYLGVVAIRARFTEKFPLYARVLKPGWDRDTTEYPDLSVSDG